MNLAVAMDNGIEPTEVCRLELCVGEPMNLSP